MRLHDIAQAQCLDLTSKRLLWSLMRDWCHRRWVSGYSRRGILISVSRCGDFHQSTSQQLSVSRSCLRGAVSSERLGSNLSRYVTIPKNRWTSILLLGVGMFVIASIFLGSGVIPSGVTTWPRNVVSVTQIRHLFPLSFSPDSLILSRTSLSALSCCSLSRPKTIMSSWSFAIFSIPLMISATRFGILLLRCALQTDVVWRRTASWMLAVLR